MKEYSEQLAKEICSKLANVEMKMDNMENWTFKVIASDETVDRVWESIKVDAWDLKNYFKNPIILFGHKYNDMDDVVWKATKVYVENNALIVEWIFAWTKSWQQLRQLYEEWILKTVSVWFIVKERDANNTKIITKAELLELSFVPVPCNPNALSLSKDVLDACIENGLIKEIETDENSNDEEIEPDKVSDVMDHEISETENEQNENNQENLENDEEKTIKEMEEVNIEKDIYEQLTDQIREKNWRNSRLAEVYTKHFVFFVEYETWRDYYDQAWKIKWEQALIDWEPTKVEPKTVWIWKTIQKSNRELLEEIKSWMSNDKDDDVETDDMEAKMKMQKEALQNVSKVVSDVLHKIKL